MTKLTKRQTEVLELIQSHLDEHGSPPTRAEIADVMGFRSPNAAEDHLRALARKGVIELIPGTSRGIRLTHTPNGLPIIGRVAAGQPILAQEHVESTYKVDRNIFKPTADYLLKVCGSSMIDAGICDGDLLAVHSTPEVQNGQIVVARIEDEVTVKRFKRNGDEITLIAENPDFEDIKVNLRDKHFNIEGLGVGILRPFTTSSSLN